MTRGFDFDAFDIKMAAAIGETAATIQLEETPSHVSNIDHNPLDALRLRRLQGIKSLGETALAPRFKPTK